MGGFSQKAQAAHRRKAAAVLEESCLAHAVRPPVPNAAGAFRVGGWLLWDGMTKPSLLPIGRGGRKGE